MRLLVGLLIGLVGCVPEPLRPGQTRCTSSPGFFGTVDTNCQAYVSSGESTAPQPRSQSTADEAPEARELREERMRKTSPAQPGPRTVVEGVRPLSCSLVEGNPDSGRCFVDDAKCAQFASSEYATTKYGPCEVRTAGACFNVNGVLDGSRSAMCAPSISDCEKRLAVARTNPDYEVTANRCGIYRVKTVPSDAARR